jgi:ATP/maltotriose-dependent transcriptional regulator MalT
MVVPSPLLETKLYIPKVRRGLVTRPRLSDRLSRGGESKLTLVSAPAGFGKTTLLAEWLASTPVEKQIAWLSLDPSDNRAGSFWPYVIAALQTVVPDVGATAISLLESPQTPITSVLATLLNDLSGLPRGIVLVLDDYHVVDANDIQDGMEYLIEHLPQQVHLVVTTRADPALPLGRWRGRGELIEIRAADLRFTPEEAAAYLNGVMKLELAARDVVALEGRTEGWIAALQLAALSIQGRDEPADFIAGFTGEQFALPDAVQLLRSIRRTPANGSMISVNAADPLNLLGIVLPTGRLSPSASNRVLYRDGVPVALIEAKEIRFLVEMSPAEQWQARQALLRRYVPPKVRAYLNQTGRTVSPPQISNLTH